MWPIMNLSHLIVWNILSSLNDVVISTNERNQTYNMAYNPAYP